MWGQGVRDSEMCRQIRPTSQHVAQTINDAPDPQARCTCQMESPPFWRNNTNSAGPAAQWVSVPCAISSLEDASPAIIRRGSAQPLTQVAAASTIITMLNKQCYVKQKGSSLLQTTWKLVDPAHLPRPYRQRAAFIVRQVIYEQASNELIRHEQYARIGVYA